MAGTRHLDNSSSCIPYIPTYLWSEVLNSQICDAVTGFLLEIGFQTMTSESPFYFEFCQGRWLDRISQSPQQNLLHSLLNIIFNGKRAREVIFDIWKSEYVKLFTNIFDSSPEKLCESVINSKGFQKNDRVKPQRTNMWMWSIWEISWRVDKRRRKYKTE